VSKHDRIWLVAVQLVERMRPFVEGRISAQVLADSVVQDCDNLKRLPLGASILRCVGRAYRYEGAKYLRMHQKQQRVQYLNPPYYHGSNPTTTTTTAIVSDVSETIRFHWRNAKHLVTAAVASGRCVIAEQKHNLVNQQKKQTDSAQTNMYQYNGGEQMQHIGQLTDEEALPSDEEMRLEEKLKAQRVFIESLQVDALWKVSKIELDEIVRQACQLILSGEHFFFPSHQSPPHHHLHQDGWYPPSDGWVGSAGIAIDANLGRLRAAQALKLMGEVMVSRSKEGTAWKQ
jgi:hypothetical protein